MAELLDPNSTLPAPAHSRMRPATLIMLLLYPIILAVGVAVGLVIGIAQGKKEITLQQNANAAKVNSSVIPNANTNVLTNTTNLNTNVSNVFLNTNSIIGGGDYLQLDAATNASLLQQQQAEEAQLVDTTGTVEDQLRQKDLIALKYNLKAYYTVKGVYPNSNGVQIRLDRGDNDIFYAAMRQFYGGSFNARIDPDSPAYYYGYTSNGTSFTLTCFLVEPNRPFVLTN